ncbi:hypothetical protein ASG29_06585 [Sphingomonas sp. Leaf412]|uniref:hypothetical protein n=1 Tax=Sphingomonas sp. Leaf412 TaxID=1736370 RepID=UPI0006F1F306|nr:hypothetical protein [Sphingomonas sp. Leaf412]KQT33673.1 hypothetical protein ASG29_06585 [Sphingomonas sp. Leaf412]
MSASATGGARPDVAVLEQLIDAAALCHRALADGGLPVAAAYVADACQSLRLAASARAAVLARELPPAAEGAAAVPLILDDGRDTGVWLIRDGASPIAVRGTQDAEGSFHADEGATARFPTAAPPDPCHDLIASADAKLLVENDLAAALLARALTDFTWVNRERRVRSLVTRGAAALTVGVLRGGRPSPMLRGADHPLLDRAVHDLLDGLGWRPELDLDLPAPDWGATGAISPARRTR